MTPNEGDVIDVWFSNGAASAVATWKTLQRYGNLCKVRVLNNPVAEEHPDNLRFQKDVEKWLGIEIISISHPKFPSNSAVDVWEYQQFMSGAQGAPCTKFLKRLARQLWEAANPSDWLVMGFTAEEQRRYDNFVLTERANMLPILIEAGITKDMCFDIIRDAGIEVPEVYRLGMPNGNCLGCVKATSPTYWNLVRELFPDVFAARAEQSRRLGARLVRVKDKRIFLDELSPEAKGRPIKSMKMPECGLFCEERILA